LTTVSIAPEFTQAITELLRRGRKRRFIHARRLHEHGRTGAERFYLSTMKWSLSRLSGLSCWRLAGLPGLALLGQ
jgi:hypothetical protein